MNFEERKMVLKMYHKDMSFVQIRDSFAGFFPERPIPGLTTLKDLIKKYEATGCLNNVCACIKKQRRQEAAPAADENVERLVVLAAIQEDPGKSLRAIEAETGIQKNKAHRFLRAAKYKSFKKQNHHYLLPTDYFPRMEFCELALERIWAQRNFLRSICFSDECTFELSGTPNRQNDRLWALENPHAINDNRTQWRASVNVWLGILGRNLIGPFFIEGSLNAQKYQQLLQHHILPAIARVRQQEDVFYMQDGAPSHTALLVRRYLDEQFPNRWIGKFGPISWPARSPDLNPCDFFLWGCIHDSLYANNTRYETRDALKVAIQEKCQHISVVQLDRTLRNFEKRLTFCSMVQGQLFEHII